MIRMNKKPVIESHIAIVFRFHL